MEIEKGTILYHVDQGIIKEVIVKRTTKTQIVINRGMSEIKIKYSGNNIYREIGYNRWDGYYIVPAPELKLKYEKQILTSYFKKFDFDSLDNETLKKLYNIVIDNKSKTCNN